MDDAIILLTCLDVSRFCLYHGMTLASVQRGLGERGTEKWRGRARKGRRDWREKGERVKKRRYIRREKTKERDRERGRETDRQTQRGRQKRPERERWEESCPRNQDS